MPKVKFVSAEEKRRRALRIAVYRCLDELGIKTGYEVAEFLDLGRTSYYKYCKNDFQNMNFDLVCRMARKLGITGEEWCAAAGIPYEKKEEE